MRPINPDGTADICAFFRRPRPDGADGEWSPSRMRPSKRRMGATPPAHLGSIQNRGKITLLIVAAAALLDGELEDRVFTFEQLVKKMRELLGRNFSLDVVDVQAVLPGMGYCLVKARGGWRWKGRRGEVQDRPTED
jgi:hypothetical protein